MSDHERYRGSGVSASTHDPDDITHVADAGILVDAHALVHGDRGDAYDHPAVDYLRVAEITNAIIGTDLTPAECQVVLVAVKLSRLGRGMQADFDPAQMRDSIVDAAGYLECLWQTLTYEGDIP
jgi:hypothetical protein